MKRSILIKSITIMLIIIMSAMALPLEALADVIVEDENEVYIKSVKLAQSGSKSKAKKLLEEAGYIFLDANLNEGTGEDGVYLGYTTTTDPAEAIYDMKLMNMKGGFTLTSMKDALASQKGVFAQMATDMTYLVEEFADAYNKGTDAAVKAYKALNFFRMEAKEDTLKEENGLGYHIVKGNISNDDIVEMLLLCDSSIVGCMVQLLVLGIQTKNENWLKKLSAAGPYDADKDYSDDPQELERRAAVLLPILKFYAQAYNAMEKTGVVSGEFNENMELEGTEYKPAYDLEAEDSDAKNLDISRYQIYKIAFEELENYTYGNKTMKEFFQGLEDTTNTRALYPLVSVLTDGEFAAMSYGCVLDLIVGADSEISDLEHYDEVYNLATEEVKSLYFYGGVNEILTEDDTIVAFTDEANRHIAATGEMEFYENETWAEDVWETGKMVAQVVASIGLGAIALAKIAIGTTMVVTCTFTTAGLCALSGVVGPAMSFLTSVTGPLGMIAVAYLALEIVLISFIISSISEWWNGLIDWRKNPIPEYIFDVTDVDIRQSSSNENVSAEFTRAPAFVFYEVVRDVYGKPVDLNARSGSASQWLTLYVSYDAPSETSKPIKAEDLLVKKGNGQTPEGYTPLCEFGEKVAKDLNSYDEDNSVNGIYMFYKQDAEVAVSTSKTYYISDVYLQAGESTEHCIGLLEAAGYTPIEVNLTPNCREEGWFSGDKIYTYLGYKLTTNKNSAVRDIRMAYGMNTSPYNFGGASYAECGSSGGVTLYMSKYAETGTPILAGGLMVVSEREDAPEGYEPVNLFSGGPAMTFNLVDGSIDGYHCIVNDYYLYFLPETTFTEGEEYLGGLAFFYTGELTLIVPIRNGTSDIYRKPVLEKIEELVGHPVSTKTEEEMQAAMIPYVMYKTGYHSYVGEKFVESFFFYKTHNPYRAIYSIKGTNISNVPTETVSEGSAYLAAPVIRYWMDPYTSNDGLSAIKGEHRMDVYIENNKLEGALYVTGNPADNTYDSKTGKMTNKQPITMSGIVCLPDNTSSELLPSEEAGFESLKDMYDSEGTEVSYGYYYGGEVIGDVSYKFYLLSEEKEELPYVNQIYMTDIASIIKMYGGGKAGVKFDMISKGMALSALGSQGATHFCPTTITMYGWAEAGQSGNNNAILEPVNTLYYGFSKTDKKSAGYTDMFLYFGGITNGADCPDTLYKGRVKYTRVCEITAYNYTGLSDAFVPRVYLFATTDKRAGEKIIDFSVSNSPFKTGYETVRTYEGNSIRSEIVEYLEHELENQTLSDARFAIKNWLAFFELPDSKDKKTGNGGIYLHFKREGDAKEVAKPYVSEIYVVETDDNLSSVREELFALGADEYINFNLNKGTTFGGGIYLGYKLTANPDEAIRDISVYHKKNPPENISGDMGASYVLASDIDLNNGCGFWSDYIYLYYTKEGGKNPISKIEISNSIIVDEVVEVAEDGTKTLVGERNTARKWNSSKPSDLNANAGGDYIYIVLTRKYDNPAGSYEEADYGKDKDYDRKDVTSVEDGAYIAALYVMDKNTIRQEKLAQGVKSSDCECSDITDQEVFDRLTQMGATTIIKTPILSVGGRYMGFAEKNQNKIFIGYSRTDNIRQAIKGILINVDIFSQGAPKETIYANKKSYKLVAEAATDVLELPRAISLIDLEDMHDNLTPHMYLYTTTSGTDPIYDISIDNNPLVTGWATALSQEGKDPFAQVSYLAEEYRKAIDEDSDNPYTPYNFSQRYFQNWLASYRNVFSPEKNNISTWYIHAKMYPGESIEEELPYITEIFIATGDTKKEALANLLEYDYDGFIDCNLNNGAGGKHIYIAYQRSATATSRTKAITNLAIFEGNNYTPVRRLYRGDGTFDMVKYELVAPVNLNEGNDGVPMYLYYTTDTTAGQPLRQLWMNHANPTSGTKDGVRFNSVFRARDNDDGFNGLTSEMINLNKGNDGERLYLTYLRDVDPPTDDIDTDFSASLIGEGSVEALTVFVGISILIAVCILIIKREKSKK